MAGDRKRFLISAGTAVVIHVAALIVIGLNPADYSDAPDFGPITVQISLDKPREQVKEPKPVEEFAAEEAPKAESVEQPQEVPAVPQPVPEPVKAPVVEAAAARPAVKPAPVIKPAEADDTIASIRSRSSGSSGGLDARATFGDDPVPSVTDRSTSAAASATTDGGESGSSVLLSDAPAAERNINPSEDDSPADVRVIDSSMMSSLDQRLSTAETSNDPAVTSSNTVVSSTEPVSGAVTGNSPVFTFDDPSVSRELREWQPPEIPEDVQSAGISRYIVKIEFFIDSDGLTSGGTVVRTSGDTRIDAAVKSVLRKWRFEDTSTTGKKVRATLTYVIEIK